MADAVDPYMLGVVAMTAGKRVEGLIGLPSEIELALARLYEKQAEADPDAEPDYGGFDDEDIKHLKDLASEAPVIRMVNHLI